MTGASYIDQVLPETIFPVDQWAAEEDFLRRFDALTRARRAEAALTARVNGSGIRSGVLTLLRNSTLNPLTLKRKVNDMEANDGKNR